MRRTERPQRRLPAASVQSASRRQPRMHAPKDTGLESPASSRTDCESSAHTVCALKPRHAASPAAPGTQVRVQRPLAQMPSAHEPVIAPPHGAPAGSVPADARGMQRRQLLREL